MGHIDNEADGLGISELQAFDAIRLKITPRTTQLVFTVAAKSGYRGFGEASASGSDRDTAAIAAELYGRYAGGRSGATPTAVLRAMMASTGGIPDIRTATAISGINQALWDLAGKEAGVPIAELLGGRRRDLIPLYANINRGLSGDRSPEAHAARAMAAVDAGFTMVKIMPFDEVVPGEVPAAVDCGLARVEAVIAAVGSTVPVMVDCHGRFGRDTAYQMVETLKRLSVRWIEEPICSHHDMHVLAGVTRGPLYRPQTTAEVLLNADAISEFAKAAGVPVAGGEFFFGVNQLNRVMDETGIGYVLPDVKHCGGICELVRISSAAQRRNVSLSPHNPTGPIATAATAQACAAMHVVDSIEYQWGEDADRASLIKPSEQIEAGHLLVPSRPGLGIDLAPSFIDDRRISLESVIPAAM